mmetsp:Transcript_1873/g.7506  ORF Transcript_1873/g.7506 Transcript_1873/m.7506 type:complete len:207 (-) Transcript_1873:1410-2030(-)
MRAAATGPKRRGSPTSPSSPLERPSFPVLRGRSRSLPVPRASSSAIATSPRSAHGGSTSIAARSSVSGRHSAFAMCASAASIARLWSRRTWHSSPKSRKASLPSRVSSKLPGCGSACSSPVSSSWHRQAATPMFTSPMVRAVASSCEAPLTPCDVSRLMSRMVSPSTHSIVSTRSAESSSIGSGTRTKSRWRCASANACPFAASRL